METDREMTFNTASPENGLLDDVTREPAPPKVKKREQWSSTMDFMVACVGGSVGLGNVWRFPYLCYKNGGGAFLIPYFVCMLLGSLPLFILEVSLGQYMSAGGMKAWNIVPLFQGIGLATVIIVAYLNCFYNTVMAWTLMYLFHSFSSILPWDSCNGWWNTPYCTSNFSTNWTSSNTSSLPVNATSAPSVDPVTEFWERKVLSLSSGIDEMGGIKWDLALCLLLAWVLVYLCICKGVKSTGKVMYFTAPAPFLLMFIILVRNATLDGAGKGVSYYLKPDISKLADISVWADAVRQTFFSSSVCTAVALTLGSYNKFKHNSCRDSVIFAFVNAFTSLLAGFLVFTILGFMSIQQGRPIDEVAESGPGLVFIAYPKAMTQMPLSQLWSVLFFSMLLLLGLDSQFVAVESLVTAVMDQFSNFLRRGYRKEAFIAILCAIKFLIGLVFITDGGMYVFQLFDYFCAGRVLFIIGFLQAVAIAYVYGVRRFLENMELMVGRPWSRVLRPYLAVTWTVTTPALCMVIFLMSTVNYKDITYSRPNQTVYEYPGWALSIGWLLTASSIVCVPGVAVCKLAHYGFTLDVLKRLMVPYQLQEHQKRPQDKHEPCLADLDSEKNKTSLELCSV